MDNWLEYALDAEKHVNEQVKKRTFAAKVFRFVFKDVLDDLVFVREIKSTGIKWTLCYREFSNRSKLFHAECRHSEFFMYIEFSDAEVDRIDRYFPAFSAEWKRRCYEGNSHFSYREFPLKTLVEAAIGETILQLLEDRYGPLAIYFDDFTAAKELFFKAENVEELMMKMDLESNG